MVKVKVCGITNLADAEKALELGADALGFNFYPPSSRCIAPETARDILGKLPKSLLNVAVVVNEPKERVEEIFARALVNGGAVGLNCVQFHGDESPEYCLNWNVKVIKAFRLKDPDALPKLEKFPVDFYLLDSWSPGYGGSGEAFPWEWLESIDPSKLILSGGLNPENVVSAISRIRPFGIDVCSGVERAPGVKDHEKLKRFIDAAKNA
ncbi:MAG TPA: phosphoribosylanthranilate isomerase [Candidatus Binatia bacterium]|jgi:phosphoribosylanthranilate isomerase